MKVVLLSEVDGLGGKGDVVDVAEGFGRNFLIPQHKAVKATRGSMKDAEEVRRIREEARNRALEEAESIAKSLVSARVVIAAQAGDEGRLFGSIGAADIVEGIQKFSGIEVDKKAVLIETPIRAIGMHEVRIKLHPEVEFPLSLDVIPA